MKLGPRADSLERDNAFDALRLLAALAVMFTHAFVVTGASEPVLGKEEAAHLGVAVFFATSGFLITRSWFQNPEVWAFLGKRALRIMPALIVVVLMSAYVLGPLLSTLSIASYYESSSPHVYALANLVFWPKVHLPGVFEHQPAHQVDGPLWTLAVEVRAYLAVALIGGVVIFRRHALHLMVLWVAVMVLAMQASSVPWQIVGGPSPAPEYLAVFGVGGCMYMLRDRIQIRGDIALVCLAIWFATTPFVWAHHMVTVFTIPYLVLAFGYRWGRPFRRLTRHGDVSYGVYIWGFVVQQIVAGWSNSPVIGLLVAVPVTYLIAFGSWHFVEKPALGMKRRLRRRAAGPLSAPLEARPVALAAPE